jgi:hypothetical protein
MQYELLASSMDTPQIEVNKIDMYSARDQWKKSFLPFLTPI